MEEIRFSKYFIVGIFIYLFNLGLSAQNQINYTPFSIEKNFHTEDFTLNKDGEIITIANADILKEDTEELLVPSHSIQTKITNMGKHNEVEIWSTDFDQGQFNESKAIASNVHGDYVLGIQKDSLLVKHILPNRAQIKTHHNTYHLPQITKLNKYGKAEWQKKVGDLKFKKFYDLKAFNSGNLYVAGHAPIKGNQIIKVDSSGNQIWTHTVHRFKKYESKLEVIDMVEDRHENLYCLLNIFDTSHFDDPDHRNNYPHNFKVLKYNKEGKKVGEYLGPKKLISRVNSMVITNNGEILISGSNYYEYKTIEKKLKNGRVRRITRSGKDFPKKTQAVIFVLKKERETFDYIAFMDEYPVTEIHSIIKHSKGFILIGLYSRKVINYKEFDCFTIGLNKNLDIFHEDNMVSPFYKFDKVIYDKENRNLLFNGLLKSRLTPEDKGPQLFTLSLNKYFRDMNTQ